MSTTLDATHDPSLRSWLASANEDTSEFPIQNLPIGLFNRRGGAGPFRPGVAIGDQIVDLLAACDARALPADVADTLGRCQPGELNAFMASGREARVALRRALSLGLSTGSAMQSKLEACLVAQADAEYAVP